MKHGLRELAQPHIRELVPYPPGKPLAELERELGVTRAIKLASNESPLGPSPQVQRALAGALGTLNRYPDGACYELRRAVADSLGLAPEQLIFGAGIDELLEFAVKAFVGPGDEVLFPWPSFAMYPIVTRFCAGTPVAVPLDASYQIDVERLLAAVTPRTRLLFLANPNNPTGRSLGEAQVRALAERLPGSVILACDEAYREYVRRPDFPDTLRLLRERPATLLLRTFSKAYGLAGLRVGFGAGDPELIGLLERTRHPFNVNSLAQLAAQTALADHEHLGRVVQLAHRGLEQLEKGLRELGYECVPSDANFLLVEFGPGALELEQRLLRRGIITRSLRAFGLERHLRITAGLPEENERLLEALRAEHQV
jgi:histidinol-phosphate aminotransferase